MTDLSDAQRQNLRAVADHQRTLGRRLYAGQAETNSKSLNVLVKLGLLDTEYANDNVKTYGLTPDGEKALSD